MIINTIHQAFVEQKAVKIHDEIIIYVKQLFGRFYPGNPNKIILDEQLTKDEIANPKEWYNPLIIRAAFAWHKPIDGKSNLFSLLSNFTDDIETVIVPLDISKFHTFDLTKTPDDTINFEVGVSELSPFNMTGAEDGTPVMRVLGKFSDTLAQERIGECKLLKLIYEQVEAEGRIADVLQI